MMSNNLLRWMIVFACVTAWTVAAAQEQDPTATEGSDVSAPDASSDQSLPARSDAEAEASASGSMTHGEPMGSSQEEAGGEADSAAQGNAELEASSYLPKPIDAEAPPAPDEKPWIEQLLPVDMTGEAGAALSLLFLSSRHNFHLEERHHQELDVAPEFALRGGIFPIRFAGAEAELGMGFSQTEDGTGAYPWSVRLHAIGQAPFWRITPFALLGFGRMGTFNKAMGDDGDPLVHFGVGGKLFLMKLFGTELLVLRLDVRDNLTQKNGASEGALTHHAEVMVGASVTLGRPHGAD
jgi:hypothetical protein